MSLDLGFTSNPLDRSAVESMTEPLARFMGDPTARGIVFAGDTPILARAGDGWTSLQPAGSTAEIRPVEEALLGHLDGAPVVALRLDPEGHDCARLGTAGQILDLRSVAVQGLVPAGELGMLAHAKSLFHWHARHRFCANCGTETHVAPSRLKRDCPNCHTQHFPRTDPVVIMLVVDGENCLLGRQERFPAGMYSCLAGFMSPGETIEDAVRREVLEEAGIRVGRVRYLASQPWPFPSSIMIGCIGEADSREITVDTTELEDGRWFTREDVRLMLAGTHAGPFKAPQPIAIANHLLRRWMAGERAS